jgi:peroxiredoxin
MHQRLNEWQAQWAMHGVRVIGIAALGADATKTYATRLRMNYAVASDEAEVTFHAYDVFAVPSLFLVDRRGTIVDASTGYSPSRLSVMEKKLISLLEQSGRE